MLEERMLNVPREGFACYLRGYLESTRELFFSIPYERPENNYKYPEETDREASDRIVSGTIVSVLEPWAFKSLSDINWHSSPNGYREWPWQLSRHPELKHLAHEYNLTGDRKYARAAEEILTSFLDNCPPPDLSAPGNSTVCWRTIELGIRMGSSWPYMLYSFYNEFPDTLLERIAESLFIHAEQLEARCTEGNWKLMEMNGLLHIAILNPYLSKAEEWKAFALSELEREAERQFYPDGFHYELTTNYHEVSLNNIQRAVELMEAFSVEVPGKLMEVLERATDVDVILMLPDRRLPDINDGSSAPVRRFLERKARLFSFPALDFVLKDGPEPSYKSVTLPYSGFAVFRSGWDEGAVYGLLDSAPIGHMHQHEDKLSFIAANGKDRFLTEGGCYAYDHSPMHDYVLSSYAHNVLLVDGDGQARRKGYAWEEDDISKRSDLAWGFSECVDWASGTYDGPYGDDERRPVSWTRSVYFLKRLEGFSRPCFVIVDRITSLDSKAHRYDLQFLIDSKREAIGDGRAIYEGGSLSFQKDASLSVIRGSMEPVRGFVSTGITVGSYKPVDALIASFTCKDVRVVTLLSFEAEAPCISAGTDTAADDIVISLGGVWHELSERVLRAVDGE